MKFTARQQHSWKFTVGSYVVEKKHFHDQDHRKVISLEHDGWLLEDGTKVFYLDNELWMYGVTPKKYLKNRRAKNEKDKH